MVRTRATRFITITLVIALPSTTIAQIPAAPPEPSAAVSTPALLLTPAVLDRAIQAGCDSSRTTGRNDADQRHGTAGWFAGGIGAGVGLGFIGTGIMTGVSALGSPQPRAIPGGQDENCYRDGYKSKAKNKNVIASLLGGLIGTGVWIAIYAANN